MRAPVLEIRNLSKTLGNREILHHISFDTLGGEVFGFLGPNGAGKTTTIKIIAGLLSIDAGEIRICGHDLATDFEAAMREVGGIVENPEFYGYLSGYENLRQYAAMREGITEERIREMVALVGLENRIRDKVSKYSLGMRQRLGVAQAMMHRPKLLILDEPTNGLDPAAIKSLRDILRNLAHDEGVSVMVSSHLMSEMEMMCDRVGIIVNGRLESVHSMEELTAVGADQTVEYILHVSNPEAALCLLEQTTEISATRDGEGMLHVKLPACGKETAIAQVNRTLVMGEVSIYTVMQKENRRLEDVFIELTEKGGAQIG